MPPRAWAARACGHGGPAARNVSGRTHRGRPRAPRGSWGPSDGWQDEVQEEGESTVAMLAIGFGARSCLLVNGGSDNDSWDGDESKEVTKSTRGHRRPGPRRRRRGAGPPTIRGRVALPRRTTTTRSSRRWTTRGPGRPAARRRRRRAGTSGRRPVDPGPTTAVGDDGFPACVGDMEYETDDGGSLRRSTGPRVGVGRLRHPRGPSGDAVSLVQVALNVCNGQPVPSTA